MEKLFKNIALLAFALYIFTLYLFVSNSSLILYSQLLFLCLIGSTFVYMIYKNRIKFGMFFILFGVFTLYSALSLIWTQALTFSYSMIKTLVQLFILGFFVFNLFEEKDLFLIPYIFLSAGILLFLYSIYVYGLKGFFNSILDGIRVGGEISQANAFGSQAAFSFIAGVYLIMFKNKRFVLFLILIPLLLVVSSGSKSAVVQIVLGSLILVFLKYKIGFKSLFVVISLVLLTYLLIKLPIFELVLHRFEVMIDTLLGDKADGSTSERALMIKVGFELFLEKPLFGYGINAYRYLAQSYFGREVYSHNNYIELLTGLGIFGLFSFYFSHLAIIYEMFFRKNKIDYFLLTIVLLYFFIDFTGPTYYDKLLYIFLPLALVPININTKIKEKRT